MTKSIIDVNKINNLMEGGMLVDYGNKDITSLEAFNDPNTLTQLATKIAEASGVPAVTIGIHPQAPTVQQIAAGWLSVFMNVNDEGVFEPVNNGKPVIISGYLPDNTNIKIKQNPNFGVWKAPSPNKDIDLSLYVKNDDFQRHLDSLLTILDLQQKQLDNLTFLIKNSKEKTDENKENDK